MAAFAAFDPPSPVLSPRLAPIDDGAPAPRTTTSPVPLSLTLSAQNPEYNDENDPSAGGPQVSWWTFARPGRWKQVQNLHNAWHEQLLANQELRMESEHLGRDYFTSKRGSTTGVAAAGEEQEQQQAAGEAAYTRPPFGMSSGTQSHMGSYFHLPKLRRRSASNEDVRIVAREDTSRRSSVHGHEAATTTTSGSGSGTPLKVDTPSFAGPPGAGPRTRRARFKAMSLPISRRQSTDEVHHPPGSVGPGTVAGGAARGHVDAFVLGPPIEGIGEEVSVQGTTGTGSRTQSTTHESPRPLTVQIPNTTTTTPVASPRRGHHPQLSIALPPPTFAPPPGTKAAAAAALFEAAHHRAPITATNDMPPPMFSERMYQAQAPPTPLGWDAPWRERDHARGGREHHRHHHHHQHQQQPHGHRGQRDSGFAVEDPWLQPFEETYEVSEASREESPRSTHTAAAAERRHGRRVGGSDSSGPLFGGTSEKTGNRSRSRSRRRRGERTMTKWAALRRSAVKNPPGTRRTKVREYLMFDARSTLYLRLLTLVGIATALGLGCKLFQLEQESDLDGILGSAPILSISYGSVSSIHCLLIMYREAFGKPIGLWGLRSKMLWVCLDLFFIALWYVPRRLFPVPTLTLDAPGHPTSRSPSPTTCPRPYNAPRTRGGHQTTT